MADHNINLHCAVCDRLQDINWGMGGFLLVPGDSPIDLITQVICQPCGHSPEAIRLMADNRRQNAIEAESPQPHYY